VTCDIQKPTIQEGWTIDDCVEVDVHEVHTWVITDPRGKTLKLSARKVGDDIRFFTGDDIRFFTPETKKETTS